jgi:AcrR family transcriptional regulator
MPRQADPLRKPQLVEEILDYLLDKPLASVSFRTIAHALGVSTYTLVYQFGTRAQLLSDIVSAISARAAEVEQRLRSNAPTMDAYFRGLRESWEWTLQPRNRQLQRLEFEAALIESIEPREPKFTRILFDTWRRIGREALERIGLSSADASMESRVILDTFYGVQFDFVLNNDRERATAAFELAMASHQARIESLLAPARS